MEPIIDQVVISETDKKLSNLHLDKYLTLLENDDVKKIIILLTNDSNAVKDVLNIIQLIIVDNKIDSSDIQLLIALFKKIVNLHGSDLPLKDMTFVNFLNIINIVFQIVIKEKMVDIKNPDEFLTETNKIINLIIEGEQAIKAVGCTKCLPCL